MYRLPGGVVLCRCPPFVLCLCYGTSFEGGCWLPLSFPRGRTCGLSVYVWCVLLVYVVGLLVASLLFAFYGFLMYVCLTMDLWRVDPGKFYRDNFTRDLSSDFPDFRIFRILCS